MDEKAIGVNNLILPEDYNNLKAVIQKEIERRSKAEGTAQGNSVGSLSSYSGSNFAYAITPATDVKVLKEHIQKIVKQINAIKSAFEFVDGSKINADLLGSITNAVVSMSSIPESSPSSGCGSKCSGLCQTACYTLCTSCTGTCQSGCTGTCSATCADTCSRSCTGSCSGSCDGCEGTCSGGCTGGCSSCTGSCQGWCKGTCSVLCNDLAWFNA